MEELRYEELDLTNDFIFSKVMRNTKLCKKLLEVILGIRIRQIEYPEEQKAIDISADAKSVRLDVYVEDESESIYNIEMQTTNPGNLPKRSRYYQGMIDLNLIEKGVNYRKLKKSYVIFICKEDIFGQERCIYTFENRCIQNTDICLGDETTKIFVNPCGNAYDIDPELKNFLIYIRTGKVQDRFTEELCSEVERVKSNKEWRREYMTLLMRYQEKLEEGREKGYAEGLEKGLEKGLAEGLEKGLAEGSVKGKFEERIRAIADLFSGGGTEAEAEKYLKATREQMAQARELLAAEQQNIRE